MARFAVAAFTTACFERRALRVSLSIDDSGLVRSWIRGLASAGRSVTPKQGGEERLPSKLGLRTQQRTSLHLVLASRILQLSAADLQHVIQEELALNPALEIGANGEGVLRARPHHQEQGAYQSPRAEDDAQVVESLRESISPVNKLIADAMFLVDEVDKPIAVYMLYSLDQHGYLRRSNEAIAAEINVQASAVERVRKRLHQLDPPGIGARDLRECLTLQCAALAANGIDSGLAMTMLSECWDDFVKQNWGRIRRHLRISMDELDAVCMVMRRRLYPYPLLLVDSEDTGSAPPVYADLSISREADGTYAVRLSDTEPVLRISTSFVSALQDKEHGGLSECERGWIAERIERARVFVAALEQRSTTLKCMGSYLVQHQRKFIEQGPAYLRPLTRAEVAAAIGVHPSTVGRATRDKIVRLPSGRCMELCAFFDLSLVAKEEIGNILSSSLLPLSDQEIAVQLRERGLDIARRTVNKYRKQLEIPSSQGRHTAALAFTESSVDLAEMGSRSS